MSELGFGTSVDTRGAPTPVRPRRARSALATILALAIVVAIGGGAAYLGRAALSGLFADPEDFSGPGSGTVRVEIEQGDSVSTIGATLADLGVVASADAFIDVSESEVLATSIQSGSYDMRMQMASSDALALLIDPSNRLFLEATLPEGLLLGDSLARLSEATGLPVEDFQAAVAAPAELGLSDYMPATVEGFIFPATYEFEPSASAREIVETTVARFEQTAAALDLVTRAQHLGATPLDIVVIASIVEAETTRQEDRARVARVLYNRLAAPMKLQLDSTVKYVVGVDGDIFTTEADRATQSPYNTYLVEGLPPAPISSPGEAALTAALNPAEGDWLFFVVVDLDTGETRFARTKAEHDANVAVLQSYCAKSELC